MPLIKRSEVFDEHLTGLIDNILKERELNQEKLKYVNDTLQEIDQKVLEKAKERGLPVDLFIPLKTVLEEGVPSFTAVDNISVYVDRKNKPKFPTRVILPSLSGEILDLDKIRQKYGKEVAEEIAKILDSINKIEEAKQSISTQYATLQKELARILAPIEHTLSNYSAYTKRLLQYLFWLLNKYNIKAVRKDGLIYALRSVLESTGRVQRSKVVDFLKLFAKIVQREYGITVNIERLMRELMGEKLSVELTRIKDIGEAAIEKIEEAIEKIQETRTKESSICPKIAAMPAIVGLMFYEKASSMINSFDKFLLSVIASLEYANLIEDIIRGSLIEPDGLIKIAEEQSDQPDQQSAQEPQPNQGQSAEEQAAQGVPQEEPAGQQPSLSRIFNPESVSEPDALYLETLFKASIYVLAISGLLVQLVRAELTSGNVDDYVEGLKNRFKNTTNRSFTIGEAIRDLLEKLDNEGKRKLKDIAEDFILKLQQTKYATFFRGFKDLVSPNLFKVFSKFFYENYGCPRLGVGLTSYFDLLQYLNAERYDLGRIISSVEESVSLDPIVTNIDKTIAVVLGERFYTYMSEVIGKPQRSVEVKTRSRYRAKIEKFMGVKRLPDGKTVSYVDGNKIEFHIPRSAILLSLPCLSETRDYKITISGKDISEAVENLRVLSSLLSETVFEHIKEFAAAPTTTSGSEKVTNIYGPKITEIFYLPPTAKQKEEKRGKTKSTEQPNLVPVIRKDMTVNEMKESIVGLVKELQNHKLIQNSIYVFLEAIASGDVSIGGKCGNVIDALVESFGEDITNLVEKFAGNLYDTIVSVLKENAKKIGIEPKYGLISTDVIYSTEKNPYLFDSNIKLDVDKDFLSSLDSSLMVDEVRKDLVVLVQRYLEFAIASLFGYDSRQKRNLVSLKFTGIDGFEYTSMYFRPIVVRLATFFTSLCAVLTDQNVTELIDKAKETLNNISNIVAKAIDSNTSITEATGTISMIGSSNRQHLGSLLAAIIIMREAIKAMKVTFDLDLPLRDITLNKSLRPILGEGGGDAPEGAPRRPSPDGQPPQPKDRPGKEEPRHREEKPPSTQEGKEELAQTVSKESKQGKFSTKEEVIAFINQSLRNGVKGNLAKIKNVTYFVIFVGKEGVGGIGRILENNPFILEIEGPQGKLVYLLDKTSEDNILVQIKDGKSIVTVPLSKVKFDGSQTILSIGLPIKQLIDLGLFDRKIHGGEALHLTKISSALGEKYCLLATPPDIKGLCLVTASITGYKDDYVFVSITPKSCEGLKKDLSCYFSAKEFVFLVSPEGKGEGTLVDLKALNPYYEIWGVGKILECSGESQPATPASAGGEQASAQS